MNDEELVIKAINGDKEAYTKLIQKYKKEMYCIAKTKLKNDVDIDDAIQETLYKAYVNIKRIKNPRYFGTWIIKILINCCNDILKESSSAAISFNDETLEYVPDNKDSYVDVHTNYDFLELVDCLTDDEKDLITLKFSGNFDTKQLSKALNIKEGSVRMRLCRIREKLRKKYDGGR